MTNKVSLVKSDSYNIASIHKAIKKSIDMIGGISSFVSKGQKVLIKPNLLAAKLPDQAVTTHPSVVEAVIRLIKEAGGKPFIGDSIPLGNWNRVINKTGIKAVADKYHIDIKEFKISSPVKRSGKGIYKFIEIAEEVREADVIINLPKLKTHSLMRLTLCVKNIFGCVVGKRKAQWHLNAGLDTIYFARMLVELYELIAPDLTIMDGVVGMEGNGPSAGIPRNTRFILSGTDCVAMDTVICSILNKDWDYLPTNIAAADMGIGETNINNITVYGESIDNVSINDFVFPSSIELGIIGLFLQRHLKQWFTNRPKEDRDICTSCGYCVSVCPPKVITQKSGKLKFDYDKCIRCFCCHEVCPEQAIKIINGYLSSLISKKNNKNYGK